MRSKTGIALAIAVATTACYRSAPTDATDAGPDAQRADAASADDDASSADDAALLDASAARTYVVLQLNQDSDPSIGAHHGFDLDGLASVEDAADGCGHADSLSGGRDVANVPEGCTASDPGCRGRVDNQFRLLLPALEAAAPSLDVADWGPAEVERQRQVIMVRLLGIDDFTNDDSVTALVYRAYPGFTTGCDEPLGPGFIDREYVIARSSLVPGATSIDEARVVVSTRIVDRRIVVRAGTDDAVDFSIGDPRGIRFTAPLRAIGLAWDFYMPDDVYGYNGNFGGWMAGDDLVDGISASFPAERAAVAAAVGQLVDIRSDGVCDETVGATRRMGGVSMGGGIRMVRARVRAVDPIVESHPPDACGFTAP